MCAAFACNLTLRYVMLCQCYAMLSQLKLTIPGSQAKQLAETVLKLPIG